MTIIAPSQSIYTTVALATAMTLAGQDDLFVGSGITLASSNGIGVQGTGSHTVYLNGSVTGTTAMQFLGDSTTIIGVGGLVAGAATGIFYAGNTTTTVLENAGSIAAETALFLNGGRIAITNTGSILGTPGPGPTPGAGNTAIYQGVGVIEQTYIDNSGLIAGIGGGGMAIHLAGSASDVLINSGLIRGLVLLGGGNDQFDSTNGLFQIPNQTFGSVFGEAGDDTLIGSAVADNLNGGSGLDTLIGLAGDDHLDGGVEADIMAGGLGSDFYFVDDTGDIVNETAGNGIDTVSTSINFSLSNAGHSIGAVERLILQTGVTSGTGNALANTITGNTGNNVLAGLAGNDLLIGGAGNDRLFGGLGNDTLTGGANNDIFVFNTPLNALTNRDTVTDFSHVNDTFQLDNAVFATLGAAGALNPAFFHAGAAAADANDHIIYNQATGALIYDANGNAAGGAIQFATLTSHPVLAANDFVVI